MSGNVIETVMGAVVLVVAALFLFFAYTTSQVRAVDGYTVTAQFTERRRHPRRQRRAHRRGQSRLDHRRKSRPEDLSRNRQNEHQPGVQIARRHGCRGHLVEPARRQIHVAGPGRLGQEHPAWRSDQIHAGDGQSRRPDRPDDLFAARGGRRKSRARVAGSCPGWRAARRIAPPGGRRRPGVSNEPLPRSRARQ